MAGAIKGWFPTLIYYSRLLGKGQRQFNEDLLKECYQIRAFDLEGRRWSKKNYPGGYTSYSSMARLHTFSSTFEDLRQKIDRHVQAYARALGFDLTGRQLSMTDCWVNIMPHRSTHGLHLHPLSTISGTYYVQTPPGCSEIKFEDPRLSKFMAAPPRRPSCRPDLKHHIRYVPRAGHLILFESWLRHEVSANPAKEDRISISFNYNWF